MAYDMVPMRDGYGKALLKLAETNDKVMVLDADVAKSTRTNWIKDKFPEKFLDMGISEQDMVGTAAGFALAGMIPFATTYCVFLAGRAWDQIRTTVSYNNLGVKLAGAHAGISVGPDGATHQSLEGVALMRVLPNMKVVVPCDAVETEKATLAIAAAEGPCFIRFGREAVPVITDETTPFTLGVANVLREGGDAVVFANGAMVHEAQEAARKLAAEGVEISVVNMHTVKPLDGDCICRMVERTGAVDTAEEHQNTGGLGGAVAEVLAWGGAAAPTEFVGIPDTFTETGKYTELLAKYGVDAAGVVRGIERVLARKH